MQFDKLRLIGFKSFCEPTDVVIEKGLTGVVGPNGCGKSNLVEALRWAMGEASYKSVRGSSMDDVIFAGSGKRSTRDKAEVTLFLDNSDRNAPADLNNADYLEVSRTITRALGSDYRVNGKTVRARDVQLLFADAATGSRSPSMVRQGQVAELIAAKPTDRRNVLEEAAGISGLRARKHEASLKLNQAEVNLSRVDDVAGEVERQVEALKRQARAAKRYKALSAEIRTLEAAVHHLRWVEARQTAKTTAEALAAARATLKEAAETQTRTATEEAAAGYAMPALREAESAAAAARASLAAELAALNEKDRQTEARLAALKKSVDALTADLKRQDGAEADAASAVARLKSEEDQLNRANDGCDERVEILEEQAMALAEAAEEADAAALAAVEKAAEVLAARAASDAAEKRARDAVRVAEADVARLTRELDAARNSDAMRSAEAGASALADAEDAETQAAATQIEAEAALAPLKAAEAETREAVEKLRAEISGRDAEAKALARLTASASSGADAALERCKVAHGYEVAFAIALGDDLSAPVSDDAPLRWTLNDGTDAALPGGDVLADKVDAPAPLRRRLAQIAVIDAADGPALQPQLKSGQRLVTREGALWRWDGFCRNAGAPSAAAERLSQKNRLAVLEQELTALRARKETAEADANAARDAARAAVAMETAARQAVGAARTKLVAARKTAAAAEAAARDAVNKETRLSAALDTAVAREAETRDALEHHTAEAPPSGESEIAARDAAKARSAAAREAAARAGNAMEAERRAVIGRMRRLERIAVELKDWQGRLAGAGQHRKDLSARLDEAVAARDDLADAPSETALERRRLTSALAKAEETLQATAGARASGEARERDAVAAARRALDGLSTAREAAGRAEERVTAAAERLQKVEEDLRDVLDVEPHQAARLAELAPDAPLPDLRDAESRLDKLKIERERIGGVNLCAEEELAEIAERQGNMMAERNDLIAAIEKLREGIKTLNKEARGRLLASFEEVNSQFQRLFTTLFGGGEASLRLTEAEDPLDAGLDIIARPPGKKPQVLSLLSGGEQTLTATALIFAVFLTNPAPICVLDEIDAPLDDANVERFCGLLEEMRRTTNTRFLVITHNPITMSRMDRLYGVTMVERGVSQLVSVSLADAEVLAESA